ncbi:MAG: glycogen synthase GlgA [Candidatus Omnitrophota bacterium]
MKILICASEMVPFAKTGGLADVVGALPLALEELGLEVRVVIPKYKPARLSQTVSRAIGSDIEVTKIGKNAQVYFIKNDAYFNREGLYGDKNGDYPDNLERFSFFCRRALEILPEINFRPDVIHCHDWQAGLIPVYLKTVYSKNKFYKHIKTVFTIHNLAYQGVFNKEKYPKLGLDWSLFKIEGLEFYGKVNFLKGGLIFSDSLSTVSLAYSKEIQTKEFGCGLEGLLHQRKKYLFGIINGLDYKVWDPAQDRYIYKKYSPLNLEDKYANKKLLQEERGLSVRADVPLLGMVSRLVTQKGLDLVTQGLEELIERSRVQMIVLGDGDAKYHNLLKDMVKKYPRNLSLCFDFNDPLAHKIYAAADIFLMPSYYEPCGLGQMIALKYGTIPLVFKTGGLSDTISEDNGFVFKDYSLRSFTYAVKRSVFAYEDKKRWLKLVKRAFTYDFSWERSAKEYLKLYQGLSD